jgi:hypothetical protein
MSEDLLWLIGIVAVWVLLNKWVLPKMGIST